MMKGECDGRELAPGAPVRVGAAGVVSGHSNEGATGRIEAGIKENQDCPIRSPQVPPVVGGSQGNGTRGFTVAELTKLENVATPKGNLQIPSVSDGAIGSFRVPSFKGDSQVRALGSLGESSIQGWRESTATGSITIPSFKGAVQEHAGALDLTRVSHDITSGSLHMTGVKGQGEGNSSKTVNMGETHNITKVTQENITGTRSMTNTKRESRSSPAEKIGMISGKRVNHDGVTTKPLEEVIKRLKQDAGAAGTTSVLGGKRGSENNTADSLGMAPVKRMSQDGASGLTGVTDVKRIRQESAIDMASVAPMVRVSQSTATETVNGAHLKKLMHGSPTGTGGDAVQGEEQDSASAIVSEATVKKINEGIGTENLQVGAMKGKKQDTFTGYETSTEMEECSEGNSANSLLPVVMQEKDDNGTANGKVLPVETASQVHPIESPPVPVMKKEVPETSDRDIGTSTVTSIKSESQDSHAGKASTAVKEEEQAKDSGTEKLAVPQQCSEENSERKQENSTKKNENSVSTECQRDTSDNKVPVSSSDSPSAKPEMVSTETQCDGSSMGPDRSAEDEYTFVSDDGVPGECLGGCEPGKKPHKCCQCDTSFRTPYELSRHGRVHSGERPYQCRLCHRCFKRKDHVEVHTRRHVEDRRHACNACGVCFVTSSCLLRHQRRTHQASSKRPGDGEDGEGEGEGETGDSKGDGKDQPASKDAQRNGRRHKKNKPDTTYRPGGKTVCIIKKRNLRQRSYSFVELEDDVECFESDEEDRIPFLKVQEQRPEEEREEFGGQAGQLEHSLFPGSLFSSEASLGHLLLLGEVSRLLSHTLVPGPQEVPTNQSNTSTPAGRPLGPPQEPDGDSDDSECDPPLVACDVTFMEGEGEVAGLSLPDDSPATPNPEETVPKIEQKAAPQSRPCQIALRARPCQAAPDTKEIQRTTCPPKPPGEGRAAPPSTPPTPGRPAAPVTNNKVPGTGVGAMGVPRTAWVVPTNNTKSKNTCDACRRRNEANRLAQMERERQSQAAQSALQQGEEKPGNSPQGFQTKNETKEPATVPAVVPIPTKPQKPKPAANKRGRKPGSKKRRPGKARAEGEGASVAPKRPYKCHLCPFSFRSATELKRHASTHSGERPFLCELCGAGFVRKCHLQLHVRRHSGERRHACQECRMRFFTPSDLARHQAIHQVGDKPLECHLCHLTFRRAFHLERHIRRHNEAAPFSCKLCGAFFSSAAALRSHDKHHRTPGPHACPDCTAAFTTATALSRHRRVHSARHHRLLRAVERHATAKSSYECVSSEGSPLSLVIRKVATTTGMSVEGGAGPAKDVPPDRPSDPAHRVKEREEEEEERDKITSGVSTTDNKAEDKMEGRKTVFSFPDSEETEVNEKTASGHPITDKECEGNVEGSETITSTSEKEKEDYNEIISSPSIAGKIREPSEKHTSRPSSKDKEEECPQVFSIPSITEKMKESDKITSAVSATSKATEGSERNTSIPSTDMVNEGKVEGRDTITSTLSTTSKETGVKGDIRSSSSHLGEKTTGVQKDFSVFEFTATDKPARMKREADNSGAISLSASGNKRVQNTANYHKMSNFSGTNSGKEIYNRSIHSFCASDRKTDHIEKTGNKSNCFPTKETGVVCNEELYSKPSHDLSPMSKERKDSKESSSCSLLVPTSRKTEPVKEEIHCRTTYHLAAPCGDPQDTLHSGSRHASEQEGSRGSTENSGQNSSVREGVATTS